jgi:hypothetical protein
MRPGVLRLVNPAALHPDAVYWLFEVLEFQYVHRWDIFLRNFRFPISEAVLDTAWWKRFRKYCKHRFSYARNLALKLRERGEKLIRRGLLPYLIWYDPALFYFNDVVLQVLPLDFHKSNFRLAMELAYKQDPARSYWVEAPHQHPFYRLGLHRVYTSRFTIPWRPFSDPLTGSTDDGYIQFAVGIPQTPRYASSPFRQNYRVEYRMRCGLRHFSELAKTLRRDFPQITIPSPVLPSYEDPAEDLIAASALPTRTMDTPRITAGAHDRAEVSPASTTEVGAAGRLTEAIAEATVASNVGSSATASQSGSCRAVGGDDHPLTMYTLLATRERTLHPSQLLDLQRSAAVGKAAAKPTAHQRAGADVEAKPTTPDGSEEEEETEESEVGTDDDTEEEEET